MTRSVGLKVNNMLNFEGFIVWMDYKAARLRVGKFRPMFRAKEMGFQEWSRFLDAIERAELDRAEQIPALFVRDFAGGEESPVLLAGEQLDRFEAASPGGWLDYPEAHEDRWIFLAGDRSLVNTLGLKLGANSQMDDGRRIGPGSPVLHRRPR